MSEGVALKNEAESEAVNNKNFTTIKQRKRCSENLRVSFFIEFCCTKVGLKRQEKSLIYFQFDERYVIMVTQSTKGGFL